MPSISLFLPLAMDVTGILLDILCERHFICTTLECIYVCISNKVCEPSLCASSDPFSGTGRFPERLTRSGPLWQHKWSRCSRWERG